LSPFIRRHWKSSCDEEPFRFNLNAAWQSITKAKYYGKAYVADLICFGQIIAELKACDRLIGTDEAQILNYMKATGKGVGLLFNFGSLLRLEWKRYVI